MKSREIIEKHCQEALDKYLPQIDSLVEGIVRRQIETIVGAALGFKTDWHRWEYKGEGTGLLERIFRVKAEAVLEKLWESRVEKILEKIADPTNTHKAVEAFETAFQRKLQNDLDSRLASFTETEAKKAAEKIIAKQAEDFFGKHDMSEEQREAFRKAPPKTRW